jgi:hypothetical protein
MMPSTRYFSAREYATGVGLGVGFAVGAGVVTGVAVGSTDGDADGDGWSVGVGEATATLGCPEGTGEALGTGVDVPHAVTIRAATIAATRRILFIA